MTTITLRNADRLQHVAVSRLTLYTAGRVHALLYPFQSWLVREVREAADQDGNADAGALALVVNQADGRWRTVCAQYAGMLNTAMRAAGSIAFEPWRLKHNRFIRQPIERMQEAFEPTSDDYRQLAQMWLRRRDWAIQVAQQRVYGDGLRLSNRIWRLEQGGMQAIRNTIAQGMAERTNAWDLAERLERQLNADREWPKWSEDRLFKMDARQRAQSKDGLWRTAADEQRERAARRAAADASRDMVLDAAGIAQAPVNMPAGISYNALRLARNEIQAANHAVTSEIARNFPGIVGRNVTLSPAHPRLDVCDELVAANPHEKTANFLPSHPQCMCFFTEVLMSRADFTKQAGAWAKGEGDFLDGYASWLGVRSFAPFPERVGAGEALELLNAMKTWLDGDVDTAAAVLKF